MRIFVAGATGAVGRPLLPLLADAGHEVVGTTRSEAKAEGIRAAGAEPAIVDVHDTEALRRLVAEAKPEVVVNELTSLPDEIDFRDPEALAATNALRRDVGPVLAAIAAEAGARRLVTQSVAFFYAPTGGPIKDEDDPLMELPPDSPMADGPVALRALEHSTTGTRGLDGLVLRYGYFYGPGTYYAPGGSTAEQVRKRRFPVVGKGTGIFSYVHVDDAASATRGGDRARRPRHLQHHRRRPRPAGRVASRLRRGDRRQAAAPDSGFSRAAGRGARGRRAGHRDARRLEREGQARAGLGAALPELAPGLPRGARLGVPARPLTMPPMTELDEARDLLIAELREHALVIGEVTLASGQTAQYYVDAKRALLRPPAHRAVGALVAAEAVERGAVAVGGMSIGADPVACAAIGAPGADGLVAFFVRKDRKQHGLQRWIEGPLLEPGTRCLVVEDVVTTGGSTVKAVERVREEGLEVAGVLSVVDRLAGGAEAIVEAAGAPYRALVTIDELYPERPDR